MRYCFRFSTKNDFLYLVFQIRVKTHFTPNGLSIYLCQDVTQFKSRGIAIMDHRKQGPVVRK